MTRRTETYQQMISISSSLQSQDVMLCKCVPSVIKNRPREATTAESAP